MATVTEERTSARSAEESREIRKEDEDTVEAEAPNVLDGFRERFEASLEIPIDAGERILARARRLREELEDLAARDTTPGSSETP